MKKLKLFGIVVALAGVGFAAAMGVAYLTGSAGLMLLVGLPFAIAALIFLMELVYGRG